MFDTPRVLSFASAAALALVLQGPVFAQTAAPAAAAPAAPAAAAAPAAPAATEMSPADAMRARAEERRARFEAMRAEREAMFDKWMKMSPEERAAMRDAHWKEMRERAAKRGVEMPETPPWVAFEQRRKEAAERFDAYRKTFDALSDEQKEAARAVVGCGGPEMMGRDWEPPMHPPMPGFQGYPPFPGAPEGMEPMEPMAPMAPPAAQ